MKSVRRNVFETNSSSMHSISYTNGDYSYELISEGGDEDDVLYISLGEYGWEWVTYDEPTDRLRYLLTNLACTEGLNQYGYSDSDDKEEFENLDEFRDVVDAVVSHTSYKDVKIKSLVGYVDHQSSMSVRSLLEEAGVSTIADFIFGPVRIRTGNDNGCDPEEDTDRW